MAFADLTGIIPSQSNCIGICFPQYNKNIIGNCASQSDCNGICFPQYNKSVIGFINSISNATVIVNTAQVINLIGSIDSISNIAGEIDAVDGDESEALGNLMYTDAFNLMLNGGLNLSTDSLKVMLLTKNYIPDVSHTYSDIILYNAEAVGDGYVAGGQEVNHVTIQNGKLRADNLYWNNVTLTNIRWALLYADNGSPVNNKVVAVFDFGKSRSVVNSMFSVMWGIYGKSYGNILQIAQREIPKFQKFITA